MIQAVMIGITGVFLALFLKQTKPEYAVCVSAGTGYFAAFSCGRALKSGDRKYPSDSECHFHPERLHSGIAENHRHHLHLRICRRYLSGRRLRGSGRADRAVFAKLSILAVSMPIVSALLQTIQSFLGG